MLKITGYSDKYSAHPGEDVKFYINAENNDSYEVQLVRLIHGDTNPEGPGYKEAEIDASCNGNYQGKIQVSQYSTTEETREVGDKWTDSEGNHWEQKEGFKVTYLEKDELP